MLIPSATTAADEACASAAFAAFSVTRSAPIAAAHTSSNAVSAVYHAATAVSAPSPAAVRAPERTEHAKLLREIIGNPFRQVAIDSACLRWNGAAIFRLAKAAFDNRFLPAGTLDNTRLLILADALEEVGCTDERLPKHLRSDCQHFRGCFVIDALLGKE
jgi:hypothetical protein